VFLQAAELVERSAVASVETKVGYLAAYSADWMAVWMAVLWAE
jgi:hypothetical protein